MKVSETYRHEIKSKSGELIGSVYVKKYFTLNFCMIQRLNIKKKYRFKGYGSKLMLKILKIYGEEILKLNFYTWDEKNFSNIQLEKFYNKFGFQRKEGTKKTLIRYPSNYIGKDFVSKRKLNKIIFKQV